MVKTQIEKMQELGIDYKLDVLLSKYTHTKTGGITPIILFPRNEAELRMLMEYVFENHISYQILGEMTNVAIASGSLSFIVICLTNIIEEPDYDSEKGILTVSAGVQMKSLSRWALHHSIQGLQWMEGIPGTVGAGTYMNAGFLAGQDFQNFMIDARVLTKDGRIKVISNSEMQYARRKSSIQETGEIVLSVRFLLRRGKKWKIALKMMQYHRRRAKHQPLNLPSAGTVFIPPTPYHVGGLLPKLGLVGYRVGGAAISQKSPGFIVSVDHMTGEDYYNLVRDIQKQFYEKLHIQLETEVRMIGFEKEDKI